MLDFFINLGKGRNMKRNILAAAVAMALTGCATIENLARPGTAVSPGTTISPGNQQAISEQRLTSDFKREGVRVTYTQKGELEAVEATGFAPVWGSSENARREAFRVAEMEAKKAMNDFINQETITSSKSVEIISRNLEKARDNKTNNFTSNRQSTITSSDDDITVEADGANADGKSNKDDTNKTENVAIRNDALRIASNTRSEIRVQNRGILSGLQLKETEVINNGRTVRATYRWDRKNSEQRPMIRGLMMQ